jgi:hypothetical protein
MLLIIPSLLRPAVIMAASIEADTSTVESDESDDDDSYNLPNFMPPPG